MQRANWMSLGIIVTLLACMAHRLASSKRDTKNASSASCRHMMVLPWKCMLVLPTSWATSRTSHEKGSFRIRSSVLFWYHLILRRATVPGQYLLVFLTFPAFRNSFCGALPPMVGQSFLQAGSSPKADGPASTAIWTNCRVGNDNGDRPTASSLLVSSTCPVISSSIYATSLVGEELLTGEGWCTGEGGCFLVISSFLAHLASCLLLLLSPFISSSCLAWLARRARSFLVLSTVLPSLSFFGVVLVLTILFKKWKEKIVVKNSYQEIQFGKQREKQKVYIKIKSYIKITFSRDFTSVAILKFQVKWCHLFVPKFHVLLNSYL